MKGWVLPAAGATLAEAALAAALAAGQLGWSGALVLHALVAALLARSLLHAAEAQPALAWLLVLGVAALGPLGVAGTALCAAVQLRAGRDLAADDWYERLFPAEPDDPGTRLYRRILRGESSSEARSSVAPFAEMMARGSYAQKQAVITRIANRFEPAFAPALRAALADAEPALRVQAATAVARIETRFLETAMALEERCAAATRAPIADTLRLARHYDDHAASGLLDAGRAEQARLRARDLYLEAMRRGVDDDATLHALIRLLVRLGRETEAVVIFAPVLDRGAGAPESFAWYVESLYRLGRHAELRAVCSRHGARAALTTGISEDCRQAVALWS